MSRFESGPRSEQREQKPLAVETFYFARHSLKGVKEVEGGSSREIITPEGMSAAVDKGRSEEVYKKVVEKAGKGEKLKIFGSPKERTSQSSLARMLGEHLKDATFAPDFDPEDLVDWVDEGGGLNRKESSLLDFEVGTGDYKTELFDHFKKGELIDWYVKKSDQKAIETAQDPDKISTLSTQAGNVAGFIWAFGSKETNETSANKEEADFSFVTSHQGVLECFLYKVIKAKEGEEAAEEFVLSLDKKGFAENEGFELDYRKLRESEGDRDNFEVVIRYKGKEYVAGPKELFDIIKEGLSVKRKMKLAREAAEKSATA
jgi:hypothetical protein